MSSLRQAFNRVANVIWGQVLVALIALTNIRVCTELMTSAQFGTAMLIMGSIAFFDGIGVMALNQTLLSRCGQVGDPETRRQISVGLTMLFLRWAGPISLGVGCLVAIILIAHSTSLHWLSLPLFALIYISTEAIKASLLSLIIVDRNYRRHSTWVGLEAIAGLTGIVVALTLWNPSAFSYLVGFVLGRAFCSITLVLIFAPNHLKKINTSIARADVKQAMNYGLPVAAMGPLGWLSTYLDRYILGTMVGASATGVYVAVTGLVARPYALTTAVLTNYFRPQLIQSKSANEEPQRYLHIFIYWTLSSIGIGLTGVLALTIISEWIAWIFLAKDFREGVQPIMILFAVSQTLAITTHAADNAILALHGSRRLLHTQIILSSFSLLIVPAGILASGVIGGLYARCISEFTRACVTAFIAKRMIRDSRASMNQ